MTIRSEYETIDEFDRRFERIVREFPTDCKLPDQMILSYYLKSFPCDFMFHLSLDRPHDLVAAKKKVRILDDSWKAVGRPDTYRNSKAISKPKNKATSFDDTCRSKLACVC